LDSDRIVQVINPSFTLRELKDNIKVGELKQYDENISICYVGRFDIAKGVISIINALKKINNCNYIRSFHFAGFRREKIENMIYRMNTKINLEFHGVLNRENLNQIYKECQFIILPSESEGFPKVLIEAASFGCIPIVPKISSILYHFNANQNRAIELADNSDASILNILENLDKNKAKYLEMSHEVMDHSRHFTYEAYNQFIKNYIIGIHIDKGMLS